MKQFLLILTTTLITVVSYAQDAKFTATVTIDSVLLGNVIQVSFELKNAKGGQFNPPQFEHFDIVGGPNQSSSFSMVNGDVSQSMSYSYYLQPREVGTFYIEPASINADDTALETMPIEINVYPNPDGVKQDPPKKQMEFDFWSTPRQGEKKKEKPKKKRKIYRM